METSEYRGVPRSTFYLLALLLLVVAGLLLYTLLRAPPAASYGPPPEPRPIIARGNLADDESSTIELFRENARSVVHITSLTLRRDRLSYNVLEIPQGTGTGFLWDGQGHVVTNFHVIQDAQRAQVTLNDNTTWRADLVGVAPDKDLAVLKIDAPAAKLRPMLIGTSNDLEVGQKVLAIGNPFGLDQTLTTGVISGLGREIESVTKHPIQGVIQTDAAINPGNSGGPLLDSSGRVIGVNTAIYSPSGVYAGIGFAVPIDTVARIVPQLIRNGQVVRPGLGVGILMDQQARALGLDGVVIMDVPEGSEAEKAGLRPVQRTTEGTLVLDLIVAIDGQPVHRYNDLYRILDNHEVGDTVKITVERNGVRQDVAITLQALAD